MEIIYANDKLERQCTNIKAAERLFGGNKSLAISLHARINAIQNADFIKDIILTPQFHFHNLIGNKDGLFAIDVKSRRDKWRIILCPLDNNKQRYNPCNIDEIAETVEVVKLEEVSQHYE